MGIQTHIENTHIPIEQQGPINKLIRIPEEKDNGGKKHQHTPSNSNLDKENSIIIKNELAMISSTHLKDNGRRLKRKMEKSITFLLAI